MNPQLPTLQQIAAKTRYPYKAFEFVRLALDFTVHALHEDPASLDLRDRHVSGTQLCQGIKRYAVEQYGHMARVVLLRWKITRTDDFGQIVFAMVNAGVMHAAESDSLRDFDAVFSFDELDSPAPRKRRTRAATQH